MGHSPERGMVCEYMVIFNPPSLAENLDHLVSAASTEDELTKLFGTWAASIGFEGFDAYGLRVDRKTQPDALDSIFICNYPVGDVAKYFTAGMIETDPVLAKVGQSVVPFDFLAFLKTCPASGAVLFQRGVLRTLGVKTAWCLPYNTVQRIQGVTLYSRTPDLAVKPSFQLNLGRAHATGAKLLDRLGALRQLQAPDTPDDAPKLSARELDCLNWIARGKTNWETAVILEISENTVRHHLKNTFRKLGTHARADAIRRAIEMGLIK